MKSAFLLLLISSPLYAMGHYVYSGDGTREWVDDVKVLQACTTQKGAVSFRLASGECPENTPNYQYSDTETRIIAEYLSDLGRAANTAAQNSKFAGSGGNIGINNQLSNDVKSNSYSGAGATSSSNSTANSSSSSNSQSTSNLGRHWHMR